MKKEKKQKQVKPKEESLSYAVEVRDKEGRVLQRVSAPSHSYVKQWNQISRLFCYSAATAGIKDTAGVVKTVTPHYLDFRANAGIGETSYGLRVGTGNTPVAIDDYVLETPCEEGTGLDEFIHQVVVFTSPAVVGPTCSFTVKRTFINNSGAPISVRELGCYNMFYLSPPGTDYFLGFRDVLGGPVNVPDGGSIRVIYTIAVTV